MDKLTKEELERRIALDFQLTQDGFVEGVKRYCGEVDFAMLRGWIDGKSIEMAEVGGEPRFFNNSVRNLLRLDKRLCAERLATEGPERAGRAYLLKHHIRAVLGACGEHGGGCRVMPHGWNFFYRLYLRDKVGIGCGEVVRYWLPAPSRLCGRQTDVEVLWSNLPLTLSLDSNHASAYAEAPFVCGGVGKVEVKYRFVSHAESHSLPDGFEHRAADRTDASMAPFLEERAPHCLFSALVRQFAEETVKNEDRPYFQARMLFGVIRERFPWASAREYSTIENIPDYVLDRHYGDCGQVTLLFIACCRYLGIPARWQSGFMLHPGYENLHDWAEIYIEGMGWIPVDVSFGIQQWGVTEEERYFYFGGMDAFRLVVNNDWGSGLEPVKRYARSETVDFQRGEVETESENLYFDRWAYDFFVTEA